MFGGGGAAPAPQNKTAQAQQRPNGGGYNFQAANGQPISAAQYAQLKGIPFRDVLQTMAKSGDKGAKIALDYVGNDFGVNRGKVKINASALPQLPGLLNSLLGGVNKY